jgi:GT2 family glycosyltransferase
MKNNFDVAVVTINFNSSQHTLRCIESIREHSDPKISVQVIVVDNNSELQDYLELKEKARLSELTLIRSRINLGFGGGMMLGLQRARAKYYFFLNNDCQFLNDCIQNLVSFSERTPGVGLCSPQLFNEEGNAVACSNNFPSIIERMFGSKVSRLLSRGGDKNRRRAPAEPISVEVLSGSQLFVSAEVFDQMGGFDPNFFLYCEEEDLALRIAKLGLTSYVVPAARNFHIGGGSTNQSILMKKEFIISLFYLYRKHYGFLQIFMLQVLLTLSYLKKSLKNPLNLAVVTMILSGARQKHSLRFAQKISPYHSFLTSINPENDPP